MKTARRRSTTRGEPCRSELAHARLPPLKNEPAASEHELGHGRRVQLDPRAGTLQIESPDGRVELSVRCTAEGCVLSFENARLALSTPGRLAWRCEELVVDAARRIELNTDGDFSSRVEGSSSTRVAGRIETESDELCLSAARGDALIRANDHVRMVGERILLNSEHERRPARDQLEAFWRDLGL